MHEFKPGLLLLVTLQATACNRASLPVPAGDLAVADLAEPDAAVDMAQPERPIDMSLVPDFARVRPDAAVTCSPGSWSWSNPLPAGDEIQGVWGAASSDVWAVGGGIIRHWNGSAWSIVVNDVHLRLLSIWGSAARDIWTAGARVSDSDGSAQGVFLHWDGSSWTPAPLDVVQETFVSVRGASANDVWAIGSAGALRHWDGNSWSPFDSGLGAANDAGIPTLGIGLWVSGPSDVWFFTFDTSVARHWNGSVWSSVTTNFLARRNALWGTAPNDLWAGGSTGLWHWDGSVWSAVSAQPPQATTPITGVWGSENDLWISRGISGEVDHWDGHAWTASSSPIPTFLDGVWGIEGGDRWIFGAAGVAARWNGSGWSATTSGVAPFNLAGTWASGPNDAWAAGTALFPGESDTALLHWDGATWTDTTPPSAAGIGLFQIWGSAANDVWAVGWNDSSPQAGKVFHWDGTKWSPSPTPSNAPLLSGVWGFAANDVWAISDEGTALHWNGSAWSTVAIPVGVNAIWGPSGGEVWVVGNGIATSLWNGSTWTPVTGAPQGTAIWGAEPIDVWIANGSSLSHWNGEKWNAITNPVAGANGEAAHGWSNNLIDSWVVGTGAAHWDGVSFTKTPVPTEESLRAVFGAGCDVWAAGTNGTILHWH